MECNEIGCNHGWVETDDGKLHECPFCQPDNLQYRPTMPFVAVFVYIILFLLGICTLTLWFVSMLLA